MIFNCYSINVELFVHYEIDVSRFFYCPTDRSEHQAEDLLYKKGELGSRCIRYSKLWETGGIEVGRGFSKNVNI